jgi:hypothetical protein
MTSNGFKLVDRERVETVADEIPADVLEYIAADAYDWTWRLEPAEKQRVLGALNSFAAARWSDLHAPHAVGQQWEWLAFR